jgi:hypothetical protein
MKRILILSLANGLMSPLALNAMESGNNVTKVRVLTSRGLIVSATITDRQGTELPSEEQGYKRGPYRIDTEWTDIGSDDPATIPTVHYTVTKEDSVTKEKKEVLNDHREIPPNSITFIQLDYERNYLALWCGLKASQLLSNIRRDRMELLIGEPFRTFTRTVIKLPDIEK